MTLLVAMSVSARSVGLCACFLLLFFEFHTTSADDECPSGMVCPGPSGRCLTQRDRCDGVNDCPDRWDEINCKPQECKGGLTICNNNRCATPRYDCTGFDKCGDNSRNLNCSACRFGSHRCADGRCIRLEGLQRTPHDVCEDGTNVVATARCPYGYFKCTNGECRPASDVCDGSNDCDDRSDEVNCAGACEGPRIECANGRCMTNSLDCSGFDVCGDGSRNKNCKSCKFGGVLCSDGRCVRPETGCQVKETRSKCTGTRN